LYFGASYPVSAPLDVGFSYEVVRRGEGNDLREWDRVEDPGLPFPSGNVLTERFMQFTARYDLGRGSFINVNGGVRFQSGGLENRDGKDYFGSIELRVGYSLARPDDFPLLLIAAVATSTISGNVINDYFDLDIDAVNRPERPIPSGTISDIHALVIYLIFIAASE